MKTTKIEITEVTPEELVNLLTENLIDKLEERFNKIVEFPNLETFLSRKETAKFLKISLPTLHDWTKSGIIPGYRIGNRVLFKKGEIINSMTKIKTS